MREEIGEGEGIEEEEYADNYSLRECRQVQCVPLGSASGPVKNHQIMYVQTSPITVTRSESAKRVTISGLSLKPTHLWYKLIQI